MSSADDVATQPLEVQRWRRYGHDRAYVESGGVALGYRDLRSGRVRADDPANEETVRQATESLLAEARASAALPYVPRHARLDAPPEAPIDEEAETSPSTSSSSEEPEDELAAAAQKAETRSTETGSTEMSGAAPHRLGFAFQRMRRREASH